MGVNTFLSESPEEAAVPPAEVIRATEEEKQQQISNLERHHSFHKAAASEQRKALQVAALQQGENLFEALMKAAPYCSLGQISDSLYAVGGKYRRNM